MQKMITKKIKMKKNTARGDEVIFLFFGLVFLVFLFISFFRLFAIGKLLDDFLFVLLFGWTKYLVYLLLFISILPIYFNCYFRFKFSFLLLMLAFCFATSWVLVNIKFLVDHDRNILWKNDVYSFHNLVNYFQQWWEKTIINNYYGFFANPISFTSWTNISSFFPDFAVGGIVANFLVTIASYGFFITNLIISFVVFLLFLSWMLFARPWLFLLVIFIIFWPIINHFKKRYNSSKKQNLSKNEQIKKQITLKTKKMPEVKKQPELVKNSIVDATKKVNVVKPVTKTNNILKESSNLTPFGALTKEPTVKLPKTNYEDD